MAKNRDVIANAGGIEPIIRLLTSLSVGIPETAARVLAHIAHLDEADEALREALATDDLQTILEVYDKWKHEASNLVIAEVERARERLRTAKAAAAAVAAGAKIEVPDTPPEDPHASQPGHRGRHDPGEADRANDEIHGSAERRAKIHMAGGIQRLISMLDGSNLSAGAAEKKKGWGAAASSVVGDDKAKGVGLKEETGLKVGMQEQAAIAIADIAFNNHDMQDAIIEAHGVTPLLTFCRTGSQLGQEHAARAIWHLAASVGVARGARRGQRHPRARAAAQDGLAQGAGDGGRGAVRPRLRRRRRAARTQRRRAAAGAR